MTWKKPSVSSSHFHLSRFSQTKTFSQIGRGHFAVVKLARHVFTGEKVAVKVIDKTKLDEVSRAHLFQEVRCMKLVQHPNVVRLYEVIDTQTKLYLILELGDGGDLYDYIMRHENGLDQESARHYFRQVFDKFVRTTRDGGVFLWKKKQVPALLSINIPFSLPGLAPFDCAINNLAKDVECCWKHLQSSKLFTALIDGPS